MRPLEETTRGSAREKLHAALLKELETTHIGQIAVTALCRRAGVNRATFYRYYQTPLDVLAEMEAEYTRTFRETVFRPDRDVRQNLIAMLRYTKENRRLNGALLEYSVISMIYGRKKEGDFIEYAFLSRLSPANARYLDGMLVSVMRTWLADDYRESPERIADLMIRVYHAAGGKDGDLPAPGER